MSESARLKEWLSKSKNVSLFKLLRKLYPPAPPAERPTLVVERQIEPTTEHLRDIFKDAGIFYEHGDKPCQIITPPSPTKMPYAEALTPAAVQYQAYLRANIIDARNGNEISLPTKIASQYLNGMKGQWQLRPLAGISTAPLLSDDGEIRTKDGYDQRTETFVARCPEIQVPEKPTTSEAKGSLRFLRHTFRTLPFADAEKVKDGELTVIDIDKSPAEDESAFLTALMTAICRPSLWVAPGYILNAPAGSGAGTGKGLLFRSMSAAAYGEWQPEAITCGHDKQEMDKRLTGELMRAMPAVFIDNVNATTLTSNTLASALTERPSRTRFMGTSKMLSLNTSAWICVTGNGLSISEDLCRRFITTRIDAGVENPEGRKFRPGFIEDVLSKRPSMLTAALTIWRWGRQQTLDAGEPLGKFEVWSLWCRDPLLALGCKDPVLGIKKAKEFDPYRMALDDLLATWEAKHGLNNWLTAHELSEEVTSRIPGPRGSPLPKDAPRQAIVSALNKLADTRVGGRVLKMRVPTGRWSATKYAVEKSD